MALYPVRVTRSLRLTPHMQRVTLAGERLAGLPFAGPDQRVKLLLPLPGQNRPYVDADITIPRLLALPDEVRPILRTYTIRAHRPEAAEVDIDFALHSERFDALGPASAWAATARPGNQVALYGPAASYRPPADTVWQLIAGDESALPAIGAIVEHLPPGVRARVVIEIPEHDDQQSIDCAPGVGIHWLSRQSKPARSSRLLHDAIGDTDLSDGPGYVWLAGESSVVTGLRRHLVTDRGLDRARITFTGYWRYGRAENDG